MFFLFALGVVSDVLLIFVSFGIDFFFAHICYLLRGIFLFSLGDPHPTTYTYPPTLQGFCADAHRFTLKCWVVGGAGWTTFVDSRY